MFKQIYKGELIMHDNKIVGSEYLFQSFLIKLFNKLGYKIETEVQKKDTISKFSNRRADIIAIKEEKNYCIEVKYSRISKKVIEKVYNYISGTDMIPVIVTAFEIKKKERENYKKKYPELKIIDISNLLYIVKDIDKLRYELISILPFSVEDISPQKSFIEVDFLCHGDYEEGLIEELELCQSGRNTFTEYEDVCYRILQSLFSEDLTLWKRQDRSNINLFRFDLLCRIKDDNKKTIWSIFENYFKSKYVIFEFKNYSRTVTQHEIYTTERYLYSKALRSVGIIVTPNGYDENALWAAKGCLRENGKLILLLTNTDLINMIRKKIDEENPSEYLLEKLDELLLELEK